ncbi:MAG TPA: bifunctional hydroxymethylpyrimidine kinase/phosphomethylpyrimidine kinase [Candidatus Limnocylindrales bacterium]
MVTVALTIAGVDSGGGAGITADLKTFEAHGVWGTCAVVAVTAQDTAGVHGVETVSPSFVREQILAVGRDIGVAAVKTGMLATAAHVEAVVDALEELGRPPLVVDPVLRSTSGTSLLDGVEVLRDRLLPLATVVTPNRAEVMALTGLDDFEGAAAALGVPVVLVTGSETARDLLWDGSARWLTAAPLDVTHTHGTGCVLSAAITAEIARGMDPVDACIAAKTFVTGAIRAGLALGQGVGPVNPGWRSGAG